MVDVGISYGALAAIIFAAIIILILFRIPISIVFLMVGVLSFAFLMPKNFLNQLGPSMWKMLNSISLTAVVPFVLMGEFLLHGGISSELYNTMEKWISRLPGGLAQANIAACALFATISGSSVSCAATMGTIAGPEMERRGYDNRLTYGTLAAGGTLGILIPPSIPMIIYGAMTGTSIGACFMAGVLPGIVCVILFMIVTAIWVLKTPRLVPPKQQGISWQERFSSLLGLIPTIVLILAVLGSIYAGITTPTEAATVGAVVALIILIAKKRFSWSVMKQATLATITVSSMSYMILAGSSLINFLFNYMHVPQSLSALLIGMHISPLAIYAMVCVMYLILGMFIDGISMIVLTIPTVVPLLSSVGFDPVWICIIIVIEIELALITPPVGVNLFILQGTSRSAKFSQIVSGAVPYMGVLVLMLVILAVFPQLALWLPSTMN